MQTDVEDVRKRRAKTLKNRRRILEGDETDSETELLDEKLIHGAELISGNSSLASAPAPNEGNNPENDSSLTVASTNATKTPSVKPNIPAGLHKHLYMDIMQHNTHILNNLAKLTPVAHGDVNNLTENIPNQRVVQSPERHVGVTKSHMPIPLSLARNSGKSSGRQDSGSTAADDTTENTIPDVTPHQSVEESDISSHNSVTSDVISDKHPLEATRDAATSLPKQLSHPASTLMKSKQPTPTSIPDGGSTAPLFEKPISASHVGSTSSSSLPSVDQGGSSPGMTPSVSAAVLDAKASLSTGNQSRSTPRSSSSLITSHSLQLSTQSSQLSTATFSSASLKGQAASTSSLHGMDAYLDEQQQEYESAPSFEPNQEPMKAATDPQRSAATQRPTTAIQRTDSAPQRPEAARQRPMTAPKMHATGSHTKPISTRPLDPKVSTQQLYNSLRGIVDVNPYKSAVGGNSGVVIPRIPRFGGSAADARAEFIRKVQDKESSQQAFRRGRGLDHLRKKSQCQTKATIETITAAPMSEDDEHVANISDVTLQTSSAATDVTSTSSITDAKSTQLDTMSYVPIPYPLPSDSSTDALLPLPAPSSTLHEPDHSPFSDTHVPGSTDAYSPIIESPSSSRPVSPITARADLVKTPVASTAAKAVKTSRKMATKSPERTVSPQRAISPQRPQALQTYSSTLQRILAPSRPESSQMHFSGSKKPLFVHRQVYRCITAYYQSIRQEFAQCPFIYCPKFRNHREKVQ